MAYGFEYIIRKLWLDPELVIDIDKFKKAVGNCNDRFRGMSQQDTHEFVTFLIDSLHEDLNRVKEKKYIEKEERELPDEIKSKIEWNNYLRRNQSILVDLFYGQFKSTVTCSECKKSCIDFNIFSSLSVNLKNINKKANSEEISNKIDKLNINSKQNSEIKNSDKTNIDEDKENKSTNQKIENSSEKITFNRNENFSINGSPLKKEGVLVGGKPNDLEATNTNNEQDDSDIIIPLVFFFYSTEEKPISFTLPIKNSKELTYKVLLLKISKIFNKDPYSLYLYHISSGDKNIISIYGNNNFSVYDHKNKKVLYVSEINSSIIENNLIANSIFYNSRLPMFTKTKYLSRSIIEKDLNDNKENIIKYINNVIDEEKDCNDIEDKYLYNHLMSFEKVFQFTLKNYIYDEENKSIKCHYFPKIVVFSKEQTFYNLYCEIIKMNKILILDSESKNSPTEIINGLFKYLVETPKEKVNKEKIFNDENNLPFYICVQKYNEKSTDNNNDEVLLLLNEQEKNKKLIDILGDIKDQNDIVNSQILLKIIWNPSYNTKIKNLIKPEKIDGFFNTLIGLNEKKNDINKLLNNSANKKPTDEEVLLAAKNHYTQLYEKHLNNNNNTNSNNSNNSNINTGYIYNNTISSINEEDKNVKSENTDNTENTINTLNSTNNSNKKENKDNSSQINSEISLDDSLDILREEELLDENNEWFCEKCKKKQRAIKKIEIYNAPKILIIQIKRFNQRDKINTKVNFPLTDLDISNYILSKEKDKKIKYDLFAVANHYGSLYFGHYTAFCKNSITNKWFEFNDSSVIEIDDESKIISHNAYVLFYKQKDLSKLDWKQIYNKQFINIDIKDNSTLVDFNYDFKKNMKINTNENNNIQDSEKNNSNSNDNDMNEFDKKLKEIYSKKKEMKSREMTVEKEETKENTDLDNENKIITEERKENDKNENMLLGKKRSSSEIN